ncbi:MAG: hypothetical protein COA78_06815 [Blastopirellula sp.]|nr:MAG: hypothetical protein COA78_06815 [Blastopirellula sp.]
MKSKQMRMILIGNRNRRLLSATSLEFVGTMLARKLSESLTVSEVKSLDNMTGQLVALGALKKCQQKAL